MNRTVTRLTVPCGLCQTAYEQFCEKSDDDHSIHRVLGKYRHIGGSVECYWVFDAPVNETWARTVLELGL